MASRQSSARPAAPATVSPSGKPCTSPCSNARCRSGSSRATSPEVRPSQRPKSTSRDRVVDDRRLDAEGPGGLLCAAGGAVDHGLGPERGHDGGEVAGGRAALGRERRVVASDEPVADVVGGLGVADEDDAAVTTGRDARHVATVAAAPGRPVRVVAGREAANGRVSLRTLRVRRRGRAAVPVRIDAEAVSEHEAPLVPGHEQDLEHLVEALARHGADANA